MDNVHANRRWGYLTQGEVQAKADATDVSQYSQGGFSVGPYKPDYADLTGKKFTMNFTSGLTLTYEFTGLHSLIWEESYGKDQTESEGKTAGSGSEVCCEGGIEGPSDGSGKRHEEYVEVLPSKDGVYFINHFVKGSNPPEAHMIVLDTVNGLVTADIARICNPYNPREVVRDFHFGLLEGYADPGYRHDFTDEMVGKAIEWTYDGAFSIKHIYVHPAYYTYVMEPYPGGGSWAATNPVRYVKIRDNLYIFTFVEERQTGTQGFFLMDLDEMHDVGSFFGMPGALMECYTFGAVGKMSTLFTKPE